VEALRGSRIDDFPSARGLLPFQGFKEVAAAARHRHVLFAGDIDAEGLGCIFYLCGGLLCLLAVITRCILAKKKKNPEWLSPLCTVPQHQAGAQSMCTFALTEDVMET
jgi:hypothetical protein